jgi:hypothetical protein
MSDILDDDEDSVRQLAGLPLLPLADGTTATLRLAGAAGGVRTLKVWEP